jgi:hypothetical protein
MNLLNFMARFYHGSLCIRASCLATAWLFAPVRASAAPAVRTPESLDPRLPAFIKAKEQQARSLAKELNITVAPGVWKAFEYYERGDWAAATNQFEKLKARNDRYVGSSYDKTISTPVWQTLVEVCTACDAFAFGEPKFARAFGDDIITSIPRGSVYFGGTDPGRGLVTALCKSHASGDPFFTITQNALADENYLIYLRACFENGIFQL